MKVKRINAFRVTALLMLTALAMMSIVPAGASPAWDWIPGTHHFHCGEGSNRTISICTYPTDTVITNKTIFYACQQYLDMEFSDRWGPGNALVNITAPKESYHSEPFYLKVIVLPLIPPVNVYVWCQVYLVDDGNGTLVLADGILDLSPVSINVTGLGDGTYDIDVTQGDGSPDVAGSALVYMPLNMDVWWGASPTDPTEVQFMFTMPFPMLTTTGFIETRIIDTTPFPGGSTSMDGSYMNTRGVPFDAETGDVKLAGSGALLDVNATLLGMIVYSDVIFTDFEVLELQAVGGVWIPVDKLALLAPYITLASTIILAVAATAIFFKYRKKP